MIPAARPGSAPVTRDPLGADTAIAYDAFGLLPIRVTDPVGLITQASYDYRVLQAREITDANGNFAGFTFSPAGFVTAQSMRGKNGEGDGAIRACAWSTTFWPSASDLADLRA